MADNNSLLTVSIVTPDGVVYEQKSTNVLNVKTQSGQLGIMPNHVPVIASLEVDEVRVGYNNQEDKVAVNGGFVEFSDNVATIVADSAEKQSDIDVDRATNARERAQNNIEQAKNNQDKDALRRNEIALRRALNRINISKEK